MLLFILILVAIILLGFWLRYDFVHGMKRKQQVVKARQYPKRKGQVELMGTGDEFFRAFYQSVKNAENHVHIMFYIFRDDYLGRRMLELLQQKAKEGVTVRLLVDRIGSSLSRKSLNSLYKAGVSFSYANKPSFPFYFFSLNRRNHRKITVVDGKVGYIGGYNIGDEYMGRDPSFGFWRDYHLRIEGDGVQDLQAEFIRDWEFATKEKVQKDGRCYPSLPKGSHELQLTPTDGVFIEEEIIRLIQSAEQSILLGTPYYIPGRRVQQAVIDAAKKGVTIKILVPKKADHPLVKEASFPYFEELLTSGVEIYQYYRGFFHGKALVIDHKLADIGTANFDLRSFHLNSEINCYLYNEETIGRAIEELSHDFAISERLRLEDVQKRSYLQRGKEQFARLVEGLL